MDEGVNAAADRAPFHPASECNPKKQSGRGVRMRRRGSACTIRFPGFSRFLRTFLERINIIRSSFMIDSATDICSRLFIDTSNHILYRMTPAFVHCRAVRQIHQKSGSMKILPVNPSNAGRGIPEENYGITSVKQIFRGEPFILEVIAAPRGAEGMVL